MNVKFAVLVILTLVLTAGCQGFASNTPTQISPAIVTDMPILYPTLTSAPSPSSSPHPLPKQPEVISSGRLNCSSLGTFTKCVDDVLNIEFEYPAVWGEIEAVLRTGGYTGYAYDYFFGGKAIAETEPLMAGGRSIDFSEGRGGMSTDFSGYGDAGLQKKGSCDSSMNDLFPLCQKVEPDVTWMIRFPNAKYICESAPGFYSTPVFRIEVNLPSNLRINGFVFEAPFFSEQFSKQIETDLYPLLGLGSDMVPTKCDDVNQQAFDAQLKVFIERISNKLADGETLKKLGELTHLATSIVFR